MFERLLIKQFAIIDYLEIDFRTPFTVMSGETGAGKSILIDAVSVLLGGRASGEMIRHGAGKAYIEGVFSLRAGHPVYPALRDGGWEGEEDSFTLSRELNEGGKNTCRINGCTVTLSRYRQLAAGLLDIHGQHEYQQIMQSHKQLDILDTYGGGKLIEVKGKAGDAYASWKELESKLQKARENQQAFAAKKDFLLYQMGEIDDAGLSPGEEEGLEKEVRRLTHSQRIVKQLNQAYRFLFQYEEGESAYDLLSKAMQQLKDLEKYDPELEGMYERLEPASYILDEISREIDKYKDQMDMSPARLEEAENRLYRIKSLGKKYGEGTEAILKFRSSLAAELEEMEEYGHNEKEWAENEAGAKVLYETHAAELSRLRSEVRIQLEAEINGEFADLAMKAARFQVDIRSHAPGPKGTDEVEFLISTNTGEPYLPLAKIASGGELSRITLAVKRILASSDTCETLIFDEIDSGIGGVTIQSVAEKLFSISADQQVVCVTHSPVLAAKAGQHFLLEKAEQAGRTTTGIKELDGQGRVRELMRMLSGDMASEDLRRHAESMLKQGGATDGF
ncbi:MAG: DNA repair protein RecN [Clostridiales bacterium]|nr:DNA repair protein RecN [Clostridiales bacterium]